MPSIMQRVFAAGEIAPALYGRADTVKYQTGLKVCLNFQVRKEGGVENRPGTEFICAAKDSTKPPRFLTFDFSDDQAYIIEVGEGYIRFIKNGVQITETAVNISGITQANPAVVTTAAPHGYSNGDHIWLDGIVGMKELNGRRFTIANVAATTFELVGEDSTSHGAYVSGGTASKVYEISGAGVPYLEADLPRLVFAQSGDVITITTHDHKPKDLIRVADNSWTFQDSGLKPGINSVGTIAAAGGAGAVTAAYKVTAVGVVDGREVESLVGTDANFTAITGITQANPGVVTAVGHGLLSGDEVELQNVGGMVEVNFRRFIIKVLTANTFELVGEDTTNYTAWAATGQVYPTFVRVTTLAYPITVTSGFSTLALYYRVYKESNGLYGFLGTMNDPATGFVDAGTLTPDLENGPPVNLEIAVEVPTRRPAVVGYSRQRRWMANTLDEPDACWASVIGDFENFTQQVPIRDDDAFRFPLAGRRFNEILHLLEIRKNILFTLSGEYSIEGDGAGNPVPSLINPVNQTHHGCDIVRPIAIGDTALFVQSRGRVARDLRFTFDSDGYRGGDLTIFSHHLFVGTDKNISRWAYAETPDSIVWAVQADGSLVGLTYVPEQDIWGWHRHSTGTEGDFLDVAAIPEGKEDRAYFLVEREINGNTEVYIERMASRDIVDQVEDSRFSDAHKVYDGQNLTLAGKDTTATMTLSAGAPWGVGDTGTLTASAATFLASDVGNEVVLRSGTLVLRLEITAFTSQTVVTVKFDRDVNVAFQGVAITDWQLAVDEIVGLNHLEGETLAVLAEGKVHAQKAVSGGKITLDRPYGYVIAGLPYIADIQTLDIDTGGRDTLLDKKKQVNELTLVVENTRGLLCGPDESSLLPIKQPPTSYDEPVPLDTGLQNLALRGRWRNNGEVLIRQSDPLPATIVGLIPSGSIGR